MKRHLIHVLQQYVLNPPIKMMFAMGIVPFGYALLETVGRRTGKPRRTPVGDGAANGEFWIVAEHGSKASYVQNIMANPRVRVKVRKGWGTRWKTGTAHVLPGDNPRERQRWLAGQRPATAVNAAVVRLMGTNLLTIRIDFDDAS